MGDFVLGLFLSVDGAFRFGWNLERGAFTSVKNEFDGKSLIRTGCGLNSANRFYFSFDPPNQSLTAPAKESIRP